ncbi:MAG: hypothetical protein A4E65_02875 [Syntrophorhabdus sp. PtaU1.Bin153]|nr:MAG: hypothetical protein A4E65_02875 [Syntrophorhabdus sp. PtaU1.Bin153]
MTIFMWTLAGLAAVTLIAYMAIPIARMIKHLFRQRDIAELMYPGDKARQARFRDKVASEILRDNQGLTYESPEFQTLYQQEMDRLLKEYRS